MKAEKQFFCKETYEEVSSDPSFVIKSIHNTFEKNWKRGDIYSNFNVD